MADDPSAPPSKMDIALRAALAASPRLAGSALIIYEGLRDRRSARMSEVLEAAGVGIDAHDLQRRLAEDERLDVLLGQALKGAADSALRAKRRLLGLLVNQAVLDDARIDESELMVSVLTQLDAPHVRCLEAVHRAEQQATTVGEIPARARGTERPLIPAITAVGGQQPTAVLVSLTSLGLLDTSGVDDCMYVKGVTGFGQRLLAALRAAND